MAHMERIIPTQPCNFSSPEFRSASESLGISSGDSEEEHLQQASTESVISAAFGHVRWGTASLLAAIREQCHVAWDAVI